MFLKKFTSNEKSQKSKKKKLWNQIWPSALTREIFFCNKFWVIYIIIISNGFGCSTTKLYLCHATVVGLYLVLCVYVLERRHAKGFTVDNIFDCGVAQSQTASFFNFHRANNSLHYIVLFLVVYDLTVLNLFTNEAEKTFYWDKRPIFGGKDLKYLPVSAIPICPWTLELLGFLLCIRFLWLQSLCSEQMIIYWAIAIF